MVSNNQPWLEKGREVPLEPELPICDPHHHLWDFRIERIEPRYLMTEILADLNSGHNIVSTVFIECGAMFKEAGPAAFKPVGETEFVNGIAAMSASGLYGPTRIAAGIVGTADLTLGEGVRPVLEAHVAAGGGRFRGIRHSGVWDASDDLTNARIAPQPEIYLNPEFRKGLSELGRMGLTFEGWCYHPQISDLAQLARAVPETSIILDHFGGPVGVGPYAGKSDEIFEKWCKDIAELARCENVSAKLGGINMEINGFGWHERDRPPNSQELMEATRRYYEFTIEHFGINRCMFESNFPVDKVTCSYEVLWNSFKRLTADYSNGEKKQLYHDNAVRVYNL